MDGFFRRSRPDAQVQDALHQHARGIYNDRIKEKERTIKLAWSCAGGAMTLAAIAIGGCIYLGTLPKTVIEDRLLDPLGYPIKAYIHDMTASERGEMRRTLVENFIKNYRETHSFNKSAQEEAIFAAIKMTNPNTPAARAGAAYFDETKPYERAKREAVHVDITSINPIGDGDTWHVAFCETVMDLRTMHAVTSSYTGVVTTETKLDRESRNRTPLGFFVLDFSFDRKEGSAKCDA